ncbi:hypothetical protein CWB73_11100 [Pseudoalteromonas phenolica]|uniref:DUF2806 domain-containing protein n=1 Tax=Pseudoalteromonas phenolica TaxID=161398 RepID=A0A5S3YT64_9GAMM|nr:hypothetical protein [Pseudoalteromonas phenolica]TMP80572.1 hypothetical protein CWB73_11100 [Pseudoalteromonas phenolica]
MEITTAKAATEKLVSTLDGALDCKPTGLSRLLLAYSPEPIRALLEKGRLRIRNLQHKELLLENVFQNILKTKNALIDKSKENSIDPLLRLQLEQLEKEYRLLCTVQKALPMLCGEESFERSGDKDTDSLWWDLFEDLASRRNEPWRVELFAKSLALNDREPGCIPLKSLWEVAMMETEDFGVLKLFLDSSLYVDGKPIILLEPEEQYSFVPDINEYQSGNLAFCISRLVDRGLVQRAATQFMTTEKVELQHAAGKTYLIHRIEGLEDGAETAIRIEGYSPTDHCLDICRLYESSPNIVTDRNLQILKELLNEEEVLSNGPKSTYKFV